MLRACREPCWGVIGACCACCGALCMLPRLLPGCPGAAHWRLRMLLLLLVILGDALLKTEPCSRDGSAWTRENTVKSPT